VFPTAFSYYCKVEAWKPYFERLLQDMKVSKGKHVPRKHLEETGYDTAAITAAQKKRSAVPAACEWLAQRLRMEPTTLRNAHSSISAKSKSSQKA
jgi:hypothetical protein